MNINRRRNYTISYFECEACGTRMPIPRKMAAYREKGHKKNIWCPRCKVIKVLQETRSCDYSRNALGEDIV